jgi:hypothetical protein
MSAEPDAGAQSTEVAGSAVVAALEDAWTAVRTHHPDVPQVVIVLGAGSETRRGLFKWGHFAAGRWHVAGANRPEVLVSGEGLRRGACDVLAPCCTRPPMAWPTLARSRTPAAKAAGTTAASPPWRRDSASRSPTTQDRLVTDAPDRAARRALRRPAHRAQQRTAAVAPRGAPARHPTTSRNKRLLQKASRKAGAT